MKPTFLHLGHSFIVEIKIQKKAEKKEGEYMEPKKVATKTWSGMRKMEVDEGKTKVKNRFGVLTVTEEEDYENNRDSVFAGRGWGI